VLGAGGIINSQPTEAAGGPFLHRLFPYFLIAFFHHPRDLVLSDVLLLAASRAFPLLFFRPPKKVSYAVTLAAETVEIFSVRGPCSGVLGVAVPFVLPPPVSKGRRTPTEFSFGVVFTSLH